ncbi:MAG TPA: alpha/beta hydrolase [Acidimicrobiia bacterium]|jgi:pimeloyl-ACP methyl ester carboxylesterase|nr:alpha/beta hydrolase [Acidimicrobiia bacterium]
MADGVVNIDGADVHYRHAGKGQPVVLIHGWPTNGDLWRDQIPVLATQFCVYALDLPGMGQSPRPAGDQYSWDGYARTVTLFMDGVGISQAHLVGHEFGAAIALLVAIRHPDRCERLAVLNTTPFPHLPWLVRLLIAVAKTPLLGRLVTSRAGISMLFRIGTTDSNTKPGDMVARYLPPASGSMNSRKTIRHVLTGLDPKGLSEIVEGVSGISCPTLILWAENDPSAPLSIAETLHETLPGSTLATISGCGHFAPEDSPVVVGERLLTFLTST